jgi:hyperosmotically inducible periplasmic protein
MMTRSHWMRFGLALAATAILSTSSARAQESGTAQKVGEKLDEAGQGIKRGVGRVGDTVKDQFERAKKSIHAMGVEGRVYGRLHWDKMLENATLDVAVAKDGTVTLSGSVANLAAKAKAIQLASDTSGVTRVVDQLAIPAPATNP